MPIKWFKVATVDTIPIQEGRRVYFKDREFALFNLGNGEFVATDNHCPHKKGPLADGIIAGRAVFCPLHSWKISLQSGCALSGGEGSVKVYPTRVVNKDVYVAFNEGKHCQPEVTVDLAVAASESDMDQPNQ